MRPISQLIDDFAPIVLNLNIGGTVIQVRILGWDSHFAALGHRCFFSTQDAFVWNQASTAMSLEEFIGVLCADYDLSAKAQVRAALSHSFLLELLNSCSSVCDRRAMFSTPQRSSCLRTSTRSVKFIRNWECSPLRLCLHELKSSSEPLVCAAVVIVVLLARRDLLLQAGDNAGFIGVP